MATYTVKQDDNLVTLAKKMGVSVQALRETNGIQTLTPGQTIRVPVQREKGQAGFYQTGEGEYRDDVYINGENVRMGPNSTISRSAPKNKFQQFLDALTGNGGGVGGNEATIRGSTNPANRGLATPTQNRAVQRNKGQAGYYQTGEGETRDDIYINGQNVRMGQNSTIAPDRRSFLDKLLGIDAPYQPSAESSIRGSNKGANALFSPAQGTGNPPRPNPFGPYASYAPQGQANSYQPYVVPPQQAQPARQFSYAPQGQPNSYQPYSNLGMIIPGANPNNNTYTPPTLGSGNMFADPSYGTTQKPPPAFNQANFQNGSNRGNGAQRWWIRPLEDKWKVAAPPPVIDPLSLQGNNTQQLTWRV